MNEVVQMEARGGGYHLYRVYRMSENSARLRVCENVGGLAARIAETVRALPAGTTADSFSVDPETLVFGMEIMLTAPGGES
jgi:hypothetical protein